MNLSSSSKVVQLIQITDGSDGAARPATDRRAWLHHSPALAMLTQTGQITHRKSDSPVRSPDQLSRLPRESLGTTVTVNAD